MSPCPIGTVCTVVPGDGLACEYVVLREDDYGFVVSRVVSAIDLMACEVALLEPWERDEVREDIACSIYLARCRTPHGVKVGTSLIVDVAEGERRALQWRAEQREGRRA